MKQIIFTFAIIFTLSAFAAAQTTAFNFQGRLNDGNNPANGKYDLEFRLYDGLTGDNIIGTAISKSNITLVNGVFSTQLDFGTAAFNGADRFLEIRLRATGSGNGFVILGPRQQILSVPYSIRSLNAGNADNAAISQNAVNATNATTATTATTAQTAVNSQQLGGVAASQFVQLGSVTAPKAMIKVFGDNQFGSNPVITKCYNSTLTGTAATTPPCGFTLNNFTQGGYGIDFGFVTQNYFVSLAVQGFATQGFENPNYGIYYTSAPSPTSLNVRTHYANDRLTTTNSMGFTIILY